MDVGKLIIDAEKLKYPGDILHEAGHLAVMPPDVRREMGDVLPLTDLHRGGELMALAWSYAASAILSILRGMIPKRGITGTRPGRA